MFRSRVSTWQRLREDGQVEDLPYAALTIYERWLHGTHNDAPWMSLETGAIHLNHILRGAAYPLVALAEDGTVLAYAEAYHSSEPEPFGDHLHLAHLITREDSGDLRAALLQHYTEHVQAMMNCHRLTVTLAGYDQEQLAWYSRRGFASLARVQRYAIPAKTGQSFYKAQEQRNADPAQVKGWQMSLGRLESSRQHWESLWPRLWDTLPEVAARRTRYIRLNVAGQDAYLVAQPQLYNVRSAEIYAWSPKPLSSQLLVAIRDWAHREGFRTLVFALTESAARVLGAEAEAEPYHYELFALDV